MMNGRILKPTLRRRGLGLLLAATIAELARVSRGLVVASFWE